MAEVMCGRGGFSPLGSQETRKRERLEEGFGNKTELTKACP
jgi:hypothetical protein